MKYRIPIVAAGITTVALASALAWTNGSSLPGIAPAAAGALTIADDGELALPDGSSVSIALAEAGSMVLSRQGTSLAIVEISPNAGWTPEIDQASGEEVEGELNNGDSRVRFEFELDGGTVDARIDSDSGVTSQVLTVTASTGTTSTVTTPGSSSTSSTSTTVAGGQATSNGNLSIPSGTSRTFQVGNAGTVIVGRNGNVLQIVSATPNAGWSSEVEVGSGREVEGDFRNGELRVKYNFELEDGVVRVRIENQNGDDNSDDDNSGSGNGDDDDDDDNSNSGSG